MNPFGQQVKPLRLEEVRHHCPSAYNYKPIQCIPPEYESVRIWGFTLATTPTQAVSSHWVVNANAVSGRMQV